MNTTIDVDYLRALEDDSKLLEALRIMGVSNWEGYEIAQAIVNANEEL